MAGVHLAIKVQQLLLGTDTEDQGLTCVLSTGSARFSTSKAPAATELFLVSPWELSHAAKKPLPASPSTHHDHSKPLTSPVLTVEVVSAKRWGAEAVIASGELLLSPLLDQLQPNGQCLDVPVALTRAGGKSANKLSRSPSGSAAAGSSLVGDGPVVGPDTPVMVLQLSTVTAPPVPRQLLGPIGSGKAEVPPKSCADASWLNWQQPVLHTGAGHVYLSPTVQLIRVTLHKAQGLHNLHVDPQAAAAAAAAIGRLAATGRSPSRADRAKAVAERAMLDGTRAGRNLLQQTSSWFKRSKASTGVQLSRPSGLGPSASSASLSGSSPSAGTGPQHTAMQSATGTSPASTGAWFAASWDGSGQATGVGAAAAAAAAPQAPVGFADAQQQPGGAAEAVEVSGAVQAPSSSTDTRLASAGTAGDTSASSPTALKDSFSAGSSGSGSSAGQHAAATVMPLAPNPHGGVAAGEHVVEEASAGAEAAAAEAAAEDAAEDTLGHLMHHGTPGSLADPVSVLQQATQHTRNSSVDAEAVMMALEENGFHATDAPGGAYFYTRISLVGVPDGSSRAPGGGSSGTSSTSLCSRVVGVSASGEASWEQGFWLPVVRPAPTNAALELELFAAKDDKTRGKSVALVRTPLHQLLLQAPAGLTPAAAAPSHYSRGRTKWHISRQGAELPWALSSHVLQASFSDHLHCSFSLTVEVADWDVRAELAGIPRALKAAPTAAATAAADGGGSISPASDAVVSHSSGEVASTDALPAGSSPSDSPRSSQQRNDAALDPFVTAAEAEAEGIAWGAAAAAAAGVLPDQGSSSTQATARQQPPPIAALDLVVKAFDTQKSLDVFFVLLVGPYCLVSSTSHSTQHHHWGWHLKLPVTEPADTLTLALLAREDQAGGRRRVGAAMLTLFSSSIKLVGKMRVRLSTLPVNTPLNISMPLQGDRTNLRPGAACAATAHLYFHLAVPQLLGSYLPAYARFSVCSPALYLLSSSPGVTGPDSTLEALEAEVQATTARWVEQQPPELPSKVLRKVTDDGRSEFTLSRTRANWRRLTLLRDATAPGRQAFSHLCSWSNPWHSGGWYCVILLFGVYPAKVLSVMLLLVALFLFRKRLRPGQPATPAAAAAAGATAVAGAASQSTKGGKSASSGMTAAMAAGAAAGAVVVAGGCGSGGSWQLFAVQPPPVMWDPAYASPDEAQAGAAALPSDPYTSLKQNYEAVISFLTLVQNVIDGWASAGERLQLALSWMDPLATGVLLVLMLLLALGLWVLGLQVLVTAGLLWVFRHPILRSPLPPPPVNFVGRLPTRSDTML